LTDPTRRRHLAAIACLSQVRAALTRETA
jgi:hypothetical protein